jgi:Ca2+-binding EF-hand superfamily protein
MKQVLIAGALAALAAGAAFADQTTTTSSADPAATFKSLDTDGNGRISESEARAHPQLSSGYRSAVSDANSGMTMEEFTRWHSSQSSSQTPPSN